MPRTSSISIRLVLLLALGGAIFVSQAATLQDARMQYHAGKLQPALKETNTLLKADPESIPALFLKAQIQSETQQIGNAIDTYKRLLALDSRHLQAYNNLAALYAQQGKLVLASETLEQAIRTDPVYTTIHTNLRAIYMDMSKKHYRQALKLKPEGNTTQIASIDLGIGTEQILNEEIQVVPQSIQEAINTTVASKTVIAKPSPQKIAPPRVDKKPAAPTKVADKTPIPPEKKGVASVPAAATAKTAAVASPGANPVAKPKPKPKPKPIAKKDPAHEVRKSLLSWANAWSNRDAKRYVNAYVKNYSTEGKTHKDWSAGRRWNFKNKKYIKVSLSEVRIKKDGQRHRVSFKQRYESNSYQDEVNKEIVFVLQGGQWKIAQESTK